ncbi:plasmid partitioning protein RepA [Roseicella aquatilis]|uniref:Plasmid partitioning protein RepA n=1 Tax=Roseicella aquatilis TaxID=2527868 RepID=A0A4R4DLX1_9PROT|nr:plasmid partitioning protein RepA [Roseicella aquatilis]TCZ61073.1 plasmid partitioning protein RepA [Roseicella aquatilis]
MGDLVREDASLPDGSGVSLDALIRQDAVTLSAQLNTLRAKLFPPRSTKQLRQFSSGEAAALIGVSDAYLRQLSLAGQGPAPAIGPGGRRSYALAQVNELRQFLSISDRRSYSPRRSAGEPLQVLAVTNFKGGSGKTTTAAHLTQYLALRGYRTLAIDLDPQSSLSALFGLQPETDLDENETLYAALRYDEHRRPLREVIRRTYFDGLDLVPANLELQEFEHDTPRILARQDRDAGSPFFARLSQVLEAVEDEYDVVVIDCPPQLGFLTLGALCAATGVIVTIHPQMLDVASMGQFLFMTSDLLEVVRRAGGRLDYRFLRYLVTRYEPQDGPQAQVVGFLRTLFGDRVLTNAMLKSTAVSDAGLTKQTLYEIGRQGAVRGSYTRALEALDAVNGEIEHLIRQAWGRVA